MPRERGAGLRPCIACESAGRVRSAIRADSISVLRCAGCGLAFLEAQPTEENLRGLYSEDYYLQRHDYYFHNPVADPAASSDNENITEFTGALRRVRALLPDARSLLDVGCGIGVFLRLAQRDGWQATGVDISPFSVQYARERFGLDVRLGTLRQAHLGREAYDLVTLWDTIEHVVSPVEELREIRRVLRSGGYLLLNTPNDAGLLKVLARALYKTTFGLVQYPVRKLYHVYHLYYFTPASLRRLVEREGFEVIELEKTLIPIEKARGSRLEKGIVRALSWLERVFRAEYQFLIIARKP